MDADCDLAALAALADIDDGENQELSELAALSALLDSTPEDTSCVANQTGMTKDVNHSDTLMRILVF